ncbi:MAG TPA: polyhydroxyalkanoic acid system family protein [Terriglobales bacterium]|jgi:hypothetical protein|nr:polyhydroxyalkanoic acid system family protein [Terriglobales bacterium]
MSYIKVAIPCQIPQDVALARIKARISRVKAQYSGKISSLNESWNGNVGTFSGSASGFTVSGNVIVEPSVVDVEVALPSVALLFKSKIESTIRDELGRLLS